jgi:hypothetical protein
MKLLLIVFQVFRDESLKGSAPHVARLSTKQCAILNRLGCLVAVTIRLFAFRELMEALQRPGD